MANTAKSAVEVEFSYFYGQESEQFTFLRIPKMIFTEEPFINLSWEARIIYSLMLERMGLSQKNGWFDEENKVYIIFTLEEVQRVLNCGRDKGMKILAELDTDKGIGLIERVKQGFSEPNHIYVKNFVLKQQKTDEEENNRKNTSAKGGRKNRLMESAARSEKSTYRGRNVLPAEVGIAEPNNINKSIKKEYGSHILSETAVDNFSRQQGKMDKTEEYMLYEQIIKENVSYDALCIQHPYKIGMIDEIIGLMVDTVCIDRKTIRINTTDYPQGIVRSIFLKLTNEHIELVLGNLENNPSQIGNIRNYLLTMLYNAWTIATGDYDAVIIGHSQFEKIPLSMERQQAMIKRQISEIELAIEQAKADNGERYTIKQMEKTRKSLSARLEKLNDTSRKDNVVTFEQLGVDRLFVDESHYYKNLFLYTKMRNVAGIAQTEAQKSSDMFAKCQYLDELTGGRGVTFATGTPISNSMTELYTNMRYLQYDTLQKLGLGHFDSWAASFGETQTAIELAPEGTGYRAKTRFAKFFNLPELISLFKESADIQTPDMLNLPVPEAEYENIVLKPSEYQQDMVASLAERAEAVRDRRVDATVDNMLKITNDGRKLALDQRLINDMLPDNEDSKAATCVNKAFEIWGQMKEQKSAQLIFCDLSTPKNDGTFNVYEDIKNKLVEKGVPENEIAFIHEANTDARKAELFGKVRSGQVRFLLGSTAKMGAGTNVQDRLIALHHLDVPWRPSDVGRILRTFKIKKNVEVTYNGKIII